MAGRLKRLAYKPFDKQRYQGLTVPDYIIEEELAAAAVRRPKPAGSGKEYKVSGPTLAKNVNIDNGYFSPLMPRYQTAIDHTDDWLYDADDVAAGQITIMSRRVPDGLAWHIDNLYFFATALGGPFGVYLLDSGDLINYFTLRVFTSSSQLSYTAWERLAPLPITSFPFLNDRIGPREAKFGLTLYEGEIIRATIDSRQAGIPIPALRSIGFRFMGIEGPKNDLQDYLELKQWHH